MKRPSDFGGLFCARRILVTGANGAGKTVMAQALATARTLPLFHNDAFALTTDWQHRPLDQIDEAREAVAATEMWIIDGGPSIVLRGATLARADLVIWLDIPRGLRMWRILRRTLHHRGQTRAELPAGNAEGFGLRQWRFMWKAWRNDAEIRAKLSDALCNSPTLHLRNRYDVAEVLERLN